MNEVDWTEKLEVARQKVEAYAADNPTRALFIALGAGILAGKLIDGLT